MDYIYMFLDFLLSIVVFIINTIVSIISSIWKLTMSIFNGTLFGYIMDTYNLLASFIWSDAATILMWLFWLVFMLIIYSFVTRMLKGRVQYHNAVSSNHRINQD